MTKGKIGPASRRLLSSEETHQILGQVVDHISDALLVIDPRSRRLLQVNGRAAVMLGYSRSELLGQRLDCVLPSGPKLVETLLDDERPSLHEPSVMMDRHRKPLEIALDAFTVDLASGKGCVVLAHPESPSADDSDKHREGLVETIVEFPSIVGRSDHIREVCRLIGLVAETDTTVLVQGESGTGKELVAQAIHFHSHRDRGPLVKVNCSALSDSLLESELFGHKKGAFTGAIQDRKGRFKLADRGTIILDEIGTMSLAGQAKLLRVLQEREFEPVGSSSSVSVDVRVVAVTNANLKSDIEAGRFREDLYYRLAAFPIRLAPLRDRSVDVPLLARHFLKRYSASLKKRVKDISPRAISHLTDYSWPGNVRELGNAIEYALILEKGRELTVASLPDKLRRHELRQRTLRERLERAERKFILEALSKTNGVKSRAAKLLGMDRRNLGYFLNKHRIEWQR